MDENSIDDGRNYEWFKQGVLALTGINLDFYKEAQMKRRINTFIARRGYQGYTDYFERISTDKQQLNAFMNYITINVTEFFRDAEPWEHLHDTVIPALVNQFKGNLRIWSTACSTGEEAYSLAMCFSDYVPLDRVHIIATDIDESVLETARKGEYPLLEWDSVPERYRNRFLVRDDTTFQMTDELKACVQFEKLDLFKDSYPAECHLIVCRNVLIYFTAEAKSHIFDGLYQSALSEAYLFFGRAENIISWKKMGYERVFSSIYKKL